jgi:hypothetical protein
MSKRSVALFVAVLVGSSSAALAAPSNAQTIRSSALAVLGASASPRLPAGSFALGPLPSSTAVHVDVTLKPPDPSAVSSFIASLSDRQSVNFHRFLRPGQFGQLFGPPLSEVAAVDAALGSDGLHPGQVTSNDLSVPVTAQASVIDRAFHVELVRYRLPGGRVSFTTLSPPKLSASVAPDVEAIIGLSDVVQPQSLAVRPELSAPRLPASVTAHKTTGGPTPCAAATETASYYRDYTADQLASYYGFDPLYSLGDFGQGVNVALPEFETEPTAEADVAAYQACYATNATVNYIPIEGGAKNNPNDSSGTEVALDIEDVIGLAPQATIDVYQGPANYAVYSDIVTSDRDQVISISWGACELDDNSAFLAAEQVLFEQAAAQGQTVLASAGDTGSTGCFRDPNTSHGSTPSVVDPASEPNVIGVGGTTLTTKPESVWNNSNDARGAGGGGVSEAQCMPSYQDRSNVPGLISTYSTKDATKCGASTPYLREVPDVSADADPNSGYVIYNGGQWGPVAGTSAAAPLWAAAAALIDSSPFCADYGAGDAGVRPDGLYKAASRSSALYGLAFNDITMGNNDYTPSGYSGGLYPATTGYDMASGLGSPKLAYSGNLYPGLAAQMCFTYATKLTTTKITGVSPNKGPSSSSTLVTISGEGFLPISGVDTIKVGTTSVTASCMTSTSCTVTLPPTRPGADDLVISVDDLTLSPVTASDQFTFEAPGPTATVRSPANHQFFSVGQRVATSFSCTDYPGGPGVSTCLDGNGSASPGRLHTSSKGTFTYSVTAKDKAGRIGNESITYTVGASNTALKLSATKVTYGHESRERLSVSLASKHPGTRPTGRVTIGERGASLCVITLSSGRGSCTLARGRLNKGIYHLTATYEGNRDLTVSTSAEKTLIVVKATTKITFKLSAKRITYGFEQAERLSVKVAPEYSGRMPTGTVTVKTPTRTLCRIRLSFGKGSCRLSAKRLKVGSYRLVATYKGSTNFKVSRSAKKALTIAAR